MGHQIEQGLNEGQTNIRAKLATKGGRDDPAFSNTLLRDPDTGSTGCGTQHSVQVCSEALEQPETGKAASSDGFHLILVIYGLSYTYFCFPLWNSAKWQVASGKCGP